MKSGPSQRPGVGRRSFIKQLAGVAALPLALPYQEQGEGNPVEIGVQLYCVRHELAKDMPGTLAALAEMGFKWVEFADYFGHSAAELRRRLDAAGLKCCGTHIYLDDLLGGKLIDTVYFNHVLGNPNLIVRWLGEERRRSREAFQSTIDDFNQIADRIKPFGMRVGYHNHDYIFDRFDEERLWDLLAEGTGSDVILQLDTGNAARAGQNVVELLQSHPGRTVSMHVKPYSAKDETAFLGRDELDWSRILQVCRTTAGTRWYIVEYEEEGVPPLEALKENLRLFKDLLASAS